MISSLFGVTYDARDALRLATFWGAAQGVAVAEGGTPESASVPASVLPRLGFQQVPEEKTVKNRVHLDLSTDDLAQDRNRLLSLGATLVAEQEHWITLSDPEGNEFDLIPI